MKWFSCIWEINSEDLCEWVSSGEGGDVLVNISDLEYNDDEIRLCEYFDDADGERLTGDVKALSDVIDMKEWIPFNELSYDMNAGLRWNK
jgi:hypothetical protein